MRVLCLRALTFVVIPLSLVTARPVRVAAQSPQPRSSTVFVEPLLRTKIEALLALPNVTLATDYYRIEMRYGPDVRIDAVVVEALNSDRRAEGLRIQVRDEANPNRLAGTSFLDFEEIASFSRALTSISEQSAKWTGKDDRRANELSFTSAGGLRLVVNSFGRAQRLFLSTGLTDPVVTSLDITELITLKQALDQALALLNSK